MAKKNQKPADGFQSIEEATITTEQFIEKNQKLLLNGLIAILVIIGGIFAYNKYYKAPLEERAKDDIFRAEYLFEKDSFYLALNGDGNFYGFENIIEKYGSTPTGNVAKYYAGLCCLYLGDYQKAIDYLEKFKAKDLVLSSLAKANIGDAYMQLGDFRKAAENYKKASSDKTNILTTPIILMKAGLAYEKSNDFKSALSMYEKIEKEFSQSMEAQEIEKYITRAKANI